MDLKRVLEFCENERSWLVETTTALAELESPTSDPEAVNRCGEELARRLRVIGAKVELIEATSAGNHLRASVGQGHAQVLLLGHMDTVWPVGQLRRMPIREEQGRLHGPGVYDMKAGIAIGILALRALDAVDARPDKRVVMLMTSDEERGSTSSRGLVEDEAARSDAVFVLEPSLPAGALKTGRKGAGEFRLRVRGVAAHAGIEPEKGASAIHEIARQILALEALRDADRGVSVNVGVVEGGSRPNVVAEEAVATIDIRVSTGADRERVEAFVRSLAPQLDRTTIDVSGGFSRPPLERTADVIRLYEMAKEIGSGLGRDLGEGSTGGGSDGNLTAALGVPTLDGLGAVGAGAHALNEHVVIDELPWRAALVASLLSRLGQT